MNEGARVHDGRQAWRLLRSNQDYVADWRANAGPVVQEAPPFPLRRQTVEDLEAARWNLLAWESPWMKLHDVPFWAGVPMLECRALDVGEATKKTLRRVVVRSGATFMGLRLRDGGLVIKVTRGREAADECPASVDLAALLRSLTADLAHAGRTVSCDGPDRLAVPGRPLGPAGSV